MKSKFKFYILVKSLLDFLFAFLGLFLSFIIFWWWIFLINLFVTKGHPIFVQKRYGKNKKVFKILKFRTMKMNAGPYLPPFSLSGEEYYKMETKFGRFLRKTSLDETLQLFNILVGKMSFVGPRPGCAFNEEDLVQQREMFSPNAYMVKPGLTGLAQVNMNKKHDPVLKAKLDSEYVSKISFSLDVKLFFKTFGLLFRK